ncbi:hypothetical protein GWZ48_002421, partial [Vibrio fluvialis]|nr:hypothetical protein [Vibrio fluvialis]
KNSSKKFGFSDKEGKFFSDDESYEHYFPSNSSFLILECDNYLGGRLPHCQILHRGNTDKLDYRRMFTSLRYEQIRHLFWNTSAGEDGIGGRVDGLSPTKVTEFLKREDKYFKTLIRSSAIKEVIYANQLLDVDAMRFCLFPLSSTDDANVDAFRALVRLLFDMKTGSDTVRVAVANIIETQKKERKDELNFDIDAFIEHNDALARRERLLNNIESLRHEFEKLSASYEELTKNKNAEQELMQFAMMAQTKFDQQSKEFGIEESQLALLEKRVCASVSECRQIESDQKTLVGEHRILLRQQNKLDDLVQKTQLLINQYDEDDTLEVILEGHREHLAEKKHELELKENAEQRQQELLDLKQEIEKFDGIAKRYQASVDNQQFKLFNQLAEPVWLKLAALNIDVAESNLGRALSAPEEQAISAFTDLITLDDCGRYQLFGVQLDAISLDKRESDQIRLAKVLAVLERKRKKAAEITAMDKENRFEQVKNITALKTEIGRTKSEIEWLLASNINSQQLQTLNQELEEVENKQQELVKKLETQNELLAQEKQKHAEQSVKVREMKSQLGNLNQYLLSAKAQLEANGLASSNFTVMPNPSLLLSEENLHQLIDNLQKKRSARTDIVNRLQDFVRSQVLENDDQLMRSFVDDELLIHAFEQLQSRYQGLEGEFDILRKNFVEHKHSIHSIINELKNNREMVRQFEQSINRAFAGVTINDLTQVEASIRVEARFSDLVGEIEHLDTHSDQKASDQFIERLKAFSQKFFPDGKAALLTMEQIVAGIAYRVKKQGQTGWESKSQSTSTIMLINLKLVEILLGRLRNKACTTHFPLIIDEGASVDSSQFDWLLPNLKQAGFRVLSASTNSASSEIIFKFGQHFRLDAMRTATPYHPARTIAFTGLPDSFVAKGSEMDREQLDMFGDADE